MAYACAVMVASLSGCSLLGLFDAPPVDETIPCEANDECLFLGAKGDCVHGACDPDTGLCVAVGRDADGDGHIDANCEVPPSAGVPDDCDDDNADTFVGAVEICDGFDNDCLDPSDPGGVVIEDQDGDGYGASELCSTAENGHGFPSGDCDDRRFAAHPDAMELCNGRDDDCDTEVDEDPGLSETCVIQVDAGGRHSCAVRRSGRVLCWGRNHEGQLGNGSFRREGTAPPSLVVGLDDVVQVALGEQHSCALRALGQVVCWGFNAEGMIGQSPGASSAVPVDVPGLADAVSIAAGLNHTCALRQSGTVSCWGSHAHNTLGSTTMEMSSPDPLDVPGITDATAVFSGAVHTCAVTGSGGVTCWGVPGRLGDGVGESHGPVEVVALTNVIGGAGGGIHTLAVNAAGHVFGWGSNLEGELGLGTTSTSLELAPVSIPEPRDVVQVAAGGFDGVGGGAFSCARTGAGELICWGANSVGQLADGTTTSRATPGRVPALTGVVDVAGGRQHACAVVEPGSVLCWGANGYGELGNDEPMVCSPSVQCSSTPLEVLPPVTP